MGQTIQDGQTTNGNQYQISSWFPTAIYIAPNIVSPQENQDITNKILGLEKQIPQGGNNWQCNMYNTCGTYDLSKDSNFKFLFDKIDDHVFEYVRYMGSSYKYECREAWANISYQHSFQEYHTHSDRTISAVYYASVPDNSGKIIFESPLEPDMLPIKNIDNYNYWSNRVAHFTPEAGMLIIFRSYLRHMVEMNNNTAPRISIAMNF
jgi:uncharacterized protein (TIGR02466 family)